MTETMRTSDVLNRAADLIEERGWRKGNSGWGGEDIEPLCLEGALLAATGIHREVMVRLWECPAYSAVADYLGCELSEGCAGRYGSRNVWRFNDHAKSASEVIEVLRACAVIEASRERAAELVSL